MNHIGQYAIDAISLGSLYALLALGLAMVFSVMNLVNWAHGEFIMIGGYTMWLLADQSNAVVIVAAIAAVVVAALILERIAFRPVRRATATTLMVTSFAVSYVLQNGTLLAAGSLPKGVKALAFLVNAVAVFGLRVPIISLVTIAVTVPLLAGLVLFLKKTPIGIQMRAAAENFTTARILGVRANTVIATSFAISGFLAGVVALLYIATRGVVTANVGLEPVIVGFVAVVIGGMGSLPGAALGGFLVGCLTTALTVVLPPDLSVYRQAFVFAAVILFLLFRPEGLLRQQGGRRV